MGQRVDPAHGPHLHRGIRGALLPLLVCGDRSGRVQDLSGYPPVEQRQYRSRQGVHGPGPQDLEGPGAADDLYPLQYALPVHDHRLRFLKDQCQRQQSRKEDQKSAAAFESRHHLWMEERYPGSDRGYPPEVPRSHGGGHRDREQRERSEDPEPAHG